MALAPTPHLERGENIFLRGEQSQKKGMRMTNRKLKGMNDGKEQQLKLEPMEKEKTRIGSAGNSHWIKETLHSR
jgi:hypothetical protein